MKRISIFLIAAALIAGMVGCGDTTPTVEIRDWHDLDAIRNNMDGSYLLMNNLDSTTAGYTELAGPTANGGKGWQPVAFTGTFDGQGYVICDLFINRLQEHYVGLFVGVGEGALIEDIGVVNVDVTGYGGVGGLAGSNYGTVNNSHFTGNVTGGYAVGGLVGYNYGTVSNSYFNGNVTGNLSTGGLVAYNAGTVSNSYSTGNVTGGSVGGLVGLNEMYAFVSNSYSTGSVTGNGSVGGLVGLNGGTVDNSYSSGLVTDPVGGNETEANIGGLVAYTVPDGSVSNSFWDTETSGTPTSDGGTGKTTAEMRDIATFSGAGWNIVAVALNETNPAYIWNIGEDETYPFLSWQP